MSQVSVASVEQLTKAGGREWRSGDRHRVYFAVAFDDACAAIGLDVGFYKTGNVSSATLYGEAISNKKATDLVDNLKCGKLWYDVAASKWEHNYTNATAAQKVIDSITSRIDG